MPETKVSFGSSRVIPAFLPASFSSSSVRFVSSRYHIAAHLFRLLFIPSCVSARARAHSLFRFSIAFVNDVVNHYLF